MQKLRPSSALLFTLLWTQPAWSHGDLDERIEHVDKEINEHKHSTELYLKRGLLKFENEQYKGAQADLQNCLHAEPNNTEALYYLAKTELKLDNVAAAKKLALHFQSLISNDPARFRAHFLLGDVALGGKQPEEAFKEFSAGLKLKQDRRPDEYIKAADSIAQTGDAGKRSALAMLEIAVQDLGPLTTLLDRAFIFEMDLKDYAAAIKHIDLQLKEAEGYRIAVLLERKAEVLLKQGQIKEARLAYAKALQQVESLPEVKQKLVPMMELKARVSRGATELKP